MTNEELNTALYKKVFAEQEKYREWLLSQPPDEMLGLDWRPETFSAAFPRSLLTRIWTTAHISAVIMPLPPTACHMCSAAGTMCQRICSALTDFPKDSLR